MSALADLEPGEHRLACPECSRGPRDRTLGVTVEYGRGVAHCFRCGYVETFDDDRVARRPGRPIQSTVGASKRETLSDYGRELWGTCRPVSGAARAYLEARACAMPPSDGDLRWHPELRHPSGYIGPALVALATDVVTREPCTLHRTWIHADGRKADVDPPRLLLAGHRKAGSVIRLWPDECVTYGLAVAEGIETALALAHAYTPVWACIDAGNLGALPVLQGVETLLVGADHDAAGTAAAQSCASRWTAAGRTAYIVTPQRAKTDINDMARAA